MIAASTDPPNTAAGQLRRRLLVGGEMLVAAVLCFIALGRRSFWLDESVSVTAARLNWPAFVHWIHTGEGNMSLYHLVLFGWVRLFGSSEIAARSLSAIAGIASVGVLYLLAKHLAGVRVALWASLLLAVNPLFVRYAQEARGYSLCLLLVTLASYLFLRALSRPGWGNWIAYALVAGLSGYAQVFAMLVPAGHAVSLLFVDRSTLPWKKLSFSTVLFLLCEAPLVYLLRSSGQSSAVGWVASNNAIGRLFTEIHNRPLLGSAVFVLGIVGLVLGYRLIARRLGTRLRTNTTWRWAFVLAWLLTPPVLVAVVAIVYEPLFLARYFIICLPPFVLLLALLLDRVRRRYLAAVTALVLTFVFLAAVVRWYRSGEVENWRGVTKSVATAARPGDGALFFAPYVRVPFALYLQETKMTDRAPAPIDPGGAWDTRSTVYGKYVPATAAFLRRRASGFRRIWLVSSHTSPYQGDYDSALAWLAATGYRQRKVEQFAGVQVALFERA